MKFILFLLFIFGGLFVGYKYITTGTPKDLGLKYDSAAYASAHSKITTEVESLPKDTPVSQSLIYSGQKEIKTELTSEEITSYLQSEKWTYAPLSQIQVKINPDGTAETSGILHLNQILPYIAMTTPIEDVKKAIDKFHISGNPPFYAKGYVVVTNNQVSFNIQSLQIGKIPVPTNYISENLNAVNKFAADRINSVPNLIIRSLNLNGGQANLDATVPALVKKSQ